MNFDRNGHLTPYEVFEIDIIHLWNSTLVKFYTKYIFFIYKSIRIGIYWLHNFQKTKPNKKGEKYYKGFIKIDLSHENL